MAKQVLGKVMMIFKGTYDSATAYEILDVVTYEGSTYVAKKETTGSVPTDENFWAILVKRPIKGLDYFTDEEKEEFVASITDDANSVFNQNVADKTTTFNENANNKMTELNTNFTNKANQLNENATNQINSIDSHVEDKITEIDTHVSEQTTTLDNHIADKTTTFDTHVTEQITTFDNHVAEKTTDFDTNADNKMSDFNENASGFIKNNEYAKDNKVGVIKTGNNLATGSDGKIYGISSSLDEYQSNANASIISKGTLENIKNNYVKEGVSSDEVKQELINQEFVQEDTVDNIVPKAEASGELVQVDDALDYKLLEVRVKPKEVSKQDSTEGYNLLPYENAVFTPSSVTWLFLDGTSGAFGNTIGEKTEIKVPVESGKTYTIYVEEISNIATMQLVKEDESAVKSNVYSGYSTFTPDFDGYIIPRIRNSETNVETYVKNVMIYEGTDQKEYEPFTGGQASPNPDYPQEIETIKSAILHVCNKNLIDEVFVNGYISSNSFKSPSTTKARSLVYKCMTNTSYVFSKNGGDRLTIAESENYPTNDLTINTIYSNASSTSAAFTTSASAKYLIIYVASPDYLDDINVQLEFGPQVTDYVKHEGQSVPIDLQGNEIVKLSNNVEDELIIDKKGNIGLIKNTKKTILAGTEDWLINSNGNLFYYRDTEFPLISSSNTAIMMSNRYLSTSFAKAYGSEVDYGIANHYEIHELVLRNKDITSIDELKANLAENNLIVYHPLDMPEIISLGNLSQLIKTFEGINNIWIESNLGATITVKYAQDLKVKHDKEVSDLQFQIDEIKTLLSTSETSAMLLDNYQSDLESEV